MRTVLVIEDEQLIRSGLIRQLNWERCCCAVIGEAENGQEGLTLIRRLQPQIVITDIRMPVMDGLEMLRRSKAEYGYEAIILSGYGEFSYAQQALALNVSDYLLKPVDLKELEDKLKRLADRIVAPEEAPLSLPRRASVYIEEHLSEELGAASLAEHFSVSADHLSRLMKKEYQLSLHEYIIALRMRRAALLLRQVPSMKIYQVAAKTGYSDYKYFHAVFTRYFGVSPSEYKDEKPQQEEL